jgi:DNA invertase Pin-like site-specific DNA recombinase
MPTSQKPLLYSYIRFSTIEQEKGHSLSRQLSYAKKIAEERGLFLDENLTMKDLGFSAYHKTNITRGALGGFLAAVEQGRVPAGSILVIESLDRISRAAPLESQGIIAQIINADITVITAADGKEYNKLTIKNNPMDLVYIILVLIRANEESETKSKRVRAAIMKQIEDWQAGKRGFRVKCGKAPQWVRWCDNQCRFVFNPREKAIMLRKIELFRQGYGGLRIAELLNGEFGVGTVHHTGANVYKEVIRRSLVGELHVKVDNTDYVLEDYYPALLSVHEFDMLVADSSKRGATKHSQKFVGILAGIDVFKCGCCGKSVGSHVIYRNKNVQDVSASHKRYGCVEARRNNCVMKHTVQLDVVESAVVRFCQDKVNLQRILLNGSDRDAIEAEDSSLKSRLIQIESDIEALMNVLITLNDRPPQAIANKIQVLETESDDIKGKLAINKNKIAKINHSFRDNVTERWLHQTNELSTLSADARLAIRQLVKDTFKSITLYMHDGKTSELGTVGKLIESRMNTELSSNTFELTLQFHNGQKRFLQVDKYTGQLLFGFDHHIEGQHVL